MRMLYPVQCHYYISNLLLPDHITDSVLFVIPTTVTTPAGGVT
jgi:hypothetical protein